MDMEVLWVGIGVVVLLVILQVCAGNKKPVRSAVSGVLLGWLALLAVNITGMVTGVTLPISALSIGVSGAAGIPGVTMLVLLDMIL
mgnify:CR=1 FL=1